MRVQPHLPSRPFTATVIESFGLPWCACSAANSPAPPEPSIRMSVLIFLIRNSLSAKDAKDAKESQLQRKNKFKGKIFRWVLAMEGFLAVALRSRPSRPLRLGFQ